MAFSDPQSITISGTTIPLPRTSTGQNGSEYTSADGLVKLSAQSSYSKRTRRVLRVDHSKVSPDVYVPTQNVKVGTSIYLVFDHPVAGYTSTELMAIYTGFKTQFSATSDALITKLLGGES